MFKNFCNFCHFGLGPKTGGIINYGPRPLDILRGIVIPDLHIDQIQRQIIL